MNIVLLSNEYPPHIYGGAGVHVDYLSHELAKLNGANHHLQILCFGDQKEIAENIVVVGIPDGQHVPFQESRHKKLLDTLYRNVVMAGSVKQADIIHCHTWYTHLAGCLLKQILGIPLVLTIHSLEPHRPWKEEQLGSGYKASTWLEKTALINADGIIAVSQSMKEDLLQLYDISAERIQVIYNGIDSSQFKPSFKPEILLSYGIDPDRPYVLFVGRITRQKGILHLINALPYIEGDVQVVLCAGAPDTEAIAKEMKEKVEWVRTKRDNHIIWISELVPREQLIVLYSHAAVFVCPSVYEPFGIINLEAMACNTPVVASAVGGIPDVVVHNETGLVVDFEPVSSDNSEPKHPEQFSRDLAAAINQILRSPERIEAMGMACRKRVEKHFDWKSIAEETLEYYRQLVQEKPRESRARHIQS
ncbi:MAG: glycogen synthase [Deltaproteobacteria bacterium]|nr:MAG: glycogen synthase [Deltaproteobacteria bacterium]